MAIPKIMKLIIPKMYSQCLHLNSKICAVSSVKGVNHNAIHTSPKNSLFFESDPKGEYKKFRQKLSPKDHVRNGLKLVREEIEVWKGEVRDAWEGEFFLKGMPGVMDVAFEFKCENDLSRWIATSDKDNLEGDSSCQLVINDNGKGLFTGNLCVEVPKDGKLKRTGYCNIRSIRCKKSFQRESHYDWGMYTHLVLRVRGDGRTYGLNLSTAGYFDITWNDMYQYALFTRGGPYWQYSKIPFSKFFFASKGKIQDKQTPVPLNNISSLGITIADKNQGPFCLEIDYIGLEFDPTHTEEFAYEMYNIPGGLAQN